MKILFFTLIILIIAIKVYLYKYGAFVVVASFFSLVFIFLALQVLKKLGYDIDIFKANKKDIKVLDEDVILDGRIIDIINSRFLSGIVFIPKFIVEKFKKMASSENQIERSKGRRGLDVIARLQETDKLDVKIIDKDFEEEDIANKVIKLAKELNASVITTSFNINKKAAIENIVVLNVNDIAFALKPVILPGDEIGIFVMKEGKEKNQGVGYLEDGTMVVVENGYDYIGRKIDVIVQSILQTSTGKIIFTRTKF